MLPLYEQYIAEIADFNSIKPFDWNHINSNSDKIIYYSYYGYNDDDNDIYQVDFQNISESDDVDKQIFDLFFYSLKDARSMGEDMALVNKGIALRTIKTVAEIAIDFSKTVFKKTKANDFILSFNAKSEKNESPQNINKRGRLYKIFIEKNIKKFPFKIELLKPSDAFGLPNSDEADLFNFGAYKINK